MRISIVTVCRNSSSTIADALRSVCGQTYSDIEYVIVDGASTDGTQEIVRRELAAWKGKQVVISEPDKGLYDAMRKGFQLATGDVIGILNSDDRLESSDVIERISAAFDSNTEAVIGDVVMARADDWTRTVRYYSAATFKAADLLRGIMPPHAGFYARRELFTKLGSYRTDYKLAGDFELMVRFFLKYPLRFKYVPGVLVRMRVGGVSNRSFANRIRLNQEVIRALRENGYRRGWLSLLTKIPGKVIQYLPRLRGV